MIAQLPTQSHHKGLNQGVSLQYCYRTRLGLLLTLAFRIDLELNRTFGSEWIETTLTTPNATTIYSH